MQTTIKKTKAIIFLLTAIFFFSCYKANNISADTASAGVSLMSKKNNDAGSAKIIEAGSERYGEYLILRHTLQFADGHIDKQTFLITGNVVPKIMGNVLIEPNKSYIVDCAGPCGCTEQWNPVTNIISCSCQPCTMTITEVK